MSDASKIPGARRLQYGALPYRTANGHGAEFMLVTSRETRRWIIPEGWPKRGKSPHRSAAHEAFEEAGVLGAIGRQSVGSFSYEKRLKNGRSVECEVRVFPLEVKRRAQTATYSIRAGQGQRDVYCPHPSARCVHCSEQKTVNEPVIGGWPATFMRSSIPTLIISWT